MALAGGLYDPLLTEGLARSFAAIDLGSAEVLAIKGGVALDIWSTGPTSEVRWDGSVSWTELLLQTESGRPPPGSFGAPEPQDGRRSAVVRVGRPSAIMESSS